MKIGIIAAMDEELVQLTAQLDQRSDMRIGQFDFHVGKINGIEVILSRCGIGKVNAAVGATLLLEKFKPNYLINIGVAGGFSNEVNVGDVVISSEVRHFDADATAFQYELGQIPQMPANYKADSNLLRIAGKVKLGDTNVAVHQGAILSGDTFVHTPQHISFLAEKFPEAMAVEMEGAAIAQTGFLFDIPFILIRSISDRIRDTDNKSVYENSLNKAAESSVRMALGILQSMN
ncbi:5'-methylthioadenosine/adenosylhomocysteine nucleosidase [Pseudodesulfovibrio tunisiensis]|uniref:5'-methylthioadenosine/adenosylhomocysteine nucleosidase n=1 Tax=Pseudodesulfovibrio tunisiensis TaxID=463192 RepID=UPI001FB1F8DF|nr:5'-methylthioadenosine/adenosylhomocysteine nucleosidase [Pseudodesulfovibrio tunisiensis]